MWSYGSTFICKILFQDYLPFCTIKLFYANRFLFLYANRFLFLCCQAITQTRWSHYCKMSHSDCLPDILKAIGLVEQGRYSWWSLEPGTGQLLLNPGLSEDSGEKVLMDWNQSWKMCYQLMSNFLFGHAVLFVECMIARWQSYSAKVCSNY